VFALALMLAAGALRNIPAPAGGLRGGSLHWFAAARQQGAAVIDWQLETSLVASGYACTSTWLAAQAHTS